MAKSGPKYLQQRGSVQIDLAAKGAISCNGTCNLMNLMSDKGGQQLLRTTCATSRLVEKSCVLLSGVVSSKLSKLGDALSKRKMENWSWKELLCQSQIGFTCVMVLCSCL